MRYARKVDFTLKTGQEKDFTKTIDTKVLPILQKQKGFQDEIVLTNGKQVTAISLWDTRQNAETYEKTEQSKVFETLKPMIEATPKVQPWEVTHTTLHATV